MNDPNAIADDLIEVLEGEYLKLAEAGDFEAIDYALAESDPYNGLVMATLMGIMARTVPDPEVVRAKHLAVLGEHVAPLWALWALKEYQKRVAKLEDMDAMNDAP